MGGKGFVWERPLSQNDLALMADRGEPIEGPVLGARTVDEGEKLELVAAHPRVYLLNQTGFDGYPAVPIRLDRVGADELAEIVDAAWRTRAPKKLLAQHPPP